MEGKINLFHSKDTSGKKPHYKGFLTIDGQEHQFALWPAKNGNGYSGMFKPKEERTVSPETQATLDKMKSEADTEIPF